MLNTSLPAVIVLGGLISLKMEGLDSFKLCLFGPFEVSVRSVQFRGLMVLCPARPFVQRWTASSPHLPCTEGGWAERAIPVSARRH